MEYLLPQALLNEIYPYLGWNYMAQMKNVSDNIWKNYCSYFSRDESFKEKFKRYWGSLLDSHSNIPYRILFLNFINFMVKYGDPIKCPKILLNDRQFILESIRKNQKVNHGWSWNYKVYRKQLPYDREVMLELLIRWPYELQFIDESLKSDKGFLLRLLKSNINIIFEITGQFKYDKELLFTAAHQLNIELLEDLKNLRRVIMLTLIRNNKRLYPFLRGSYKNDPEFRPFFPLCETNVDMPTADRETTLNAVRDGVPYYCIDRKFWLDEEIAIMALRGDLSSIDFLNSKLTRNRQFVYKAVQVQPMALRYCHVNDDPEIVFLASKHFGPVFKFASPELKKNKDFVSKILSLDKSLFYYIDDNLKCDGDVIRIIST